MGPLWKEIGDLVTRNMGKTELLHEFFTQSALVSASSMLPKLQKSQKVKRLENHLT